MNIHRAFFGLVLGASLTMTNCFISTDGDDREECQDACNDAHLTCVNACSDDACVSACSNARNACVDDC